MGTRPTWTLALSHTSIMKALSCHFQTTFKIEMQKDSYLWQAGAARSLMLQLAQMQSVYFIFFYRL